MSARKKPPPKKPQLTWKKPGPRKSTGLKLIIETLLEAHATVLTAYQFLRDSIDREAREYALAKLREGIEAIDTVINQLAEVRRRQRPRAGGAS